MATADTEKTRLLAADGSGSDASARVARRSRDGDDRRSEAQHPAGNTRGLNVSSWLAPVTFLAGVSIAVVAVSSRFAAPPADNSDTIGRPTAVPETGRCDVPPAPRLFLACHDDAGADMALAVTSKIAERLGAWRTSARGSEPIYAPFDEGDRRDALPCDDDDENRLDPARDDDCRPELSLPWAQIWRRWNRRSPADADHHHPSSSGDPSTKNKNAKDQDQDPVVSALARCRADYRVVHFARDPMALALRATHARRDDDLVRDLPARQAALVAMELERTRFAGGVGLMDMMDGLRRAREDPHRQTVTRTEDAESGGSSFGDAWEAAARWADPGASDEDIARVVEAAREEDPAREGVARGKESRAGAELGMTEEEEAEARCALMTDADFGPMLRGFQETAGYAPMSDEEVAAACALAGIDVGEDARGDEGAEDEGEGGR